MTTPRPYPHKGDRPPWSWQGAAALVLAVSVGGGWLAGVVLAALESVHNGLDDGLASLLNGIGQVLAGALGTYLGFAAGTHSPDRERTDPDARPPGAPGSGGGSGSAGGPDQTGAPPSDG